MENLYDWKQEVIKLCDELSEQLELSRHTIHIMVNLSKDAVSEDESSESSRRMVNLEALKGQDDNQYKVTSYSICLYEPDYPEVKDENGNSKKNTSICRIAYNVMKSKTTISFFIKEKTAENIQNDPFMDLARKTVNGFREYKMDEALLHTNIPKVLQFLKEVILYEIANYVPRAQTFGCCGKFRECSDAGRCLHANKLYACACQYKKNLLSGKVFYGQTKTA